jgi:hypothetical protein
MPSHSRRITTEAGEATDRFRSRIGQWCLVDCPEMLRRGESEVVRLVHLLNSGSTTYTRQTQETSGSSRFTSHVLRIFYRRRSRPWGVLRS